MKKGVARFGIVLSVALAFIIIQLAPASSSPLAASPAHAVPPPVKTSWVPPHLAPTKTVEPSTIWIKGYGKGPETATVTLRADAVGDPAAEGLDLVLAADCTGSMAMEIDKVRTSFSWIVDQISPKIPDTRFGIASFQDYPVDPFGVPTDYAYRMDTDFTTDTEIVQSAINSIQIGNGWDTPESYPTVVYNSVHDMSWRSSDYTSKILIIMGDSPPHDKRYNTEYPSGYDYDTPAGEPPYTWVDDRAGGINVAKEAVNNGVIVCMITTGYGVSDPTSLQSHQDMADYTGGKHVLATDINMIPQIIVNLMKNLTKFNDTAAIQPSPTEYMITDMLPPYIEFQGTWQPTPNNTADIKNFDYVQSANGLWELRFDVRKMNIGDVFEIQYDIKSTLHGWQSIGVTSYNATNVYGSDFSKVKYQNYEYWKTTNPADIWTNETTDCSIFTEYYEPPPPDPPLVAPPSPPPEMPPPPPTIMYPPDGLGIPPSVPDQKPLIPVMPSSPKDDVYFPFQLMIPRLNVSEASGDNTTTATEQYCPTATPTYLNAMVKSMMKTAVVILVGYILTIVWRIRRTGWAKRRCQTCPLRQGACRSAATHPYYP